jgi:ferric-dicitrate binding protein FerR (iron transport regulator)
VKQDKQASELVQRYVDGLASADETRQLAERLRADAELREQFLEYVNVDLALEDYAAGGEASPATTIEVSRPIPRRRWRSVLGLAVAAALTVTIAIWSVRKRPPSGIDRPSSPFVAAEVLAADGVQWVGQGPPLAAGTRIEVDRIRIAQGKLTLRLESGVVLELLGPADASFETPLRLRLAKGRLNADVGRGGRGFTVATAAGEVVDLGTRFAVDVSEEGETRTAVFSGQVRIDSVNGAGRRDRSWHLCEGEAVRFRKREKPRRLASLPLSPSGGLQAEANRSGIIAGVSDNVVDADFHRFYGVVPRGMADGASAYTDNHNQRWRALPGEAFPAELEGADSIRPFQSDRHALDLKVTVELSQPAVLYVMHDVRKPPPDWLAEGFADTGMRLRCGPWRPEGHAVRDVAPDETGQYFLQYSVWRKEVPVAGPVELGPPHLRGRGGPSAMYGIAVKPLARLSESQ